MSAETPDRYAARPGETYLGDGLFVSFDGLQIALRAPREDQDHWVYLEAAVWVALKKYMAKLEAP